ncbi:MAG: UDP-N-acetylmuramate:L-alanyl-gamma-D-glutamyl-meso-diaminopimelate ligase [Cellvibrionaceae bacterium]
MHIHFLGICGTFMGSLAQLAKALGHQVTGCDANVYPPMSTQLQQAGIELIQGFDPKQLEPAPDLVVVGNAMSRGNPVVEALLDSTIPYTSGPQWLSQHLLRDRWVLAVAGTHGKTSTTSMLAWILEHAGMEPGFLIGGVPGNFGVSARLGKSDFFVIEADEYDTAFFDKRSKFVHYHPRTLLLNNLEYDHADIFENLEAIQKQFHHVVRVVPRNGLVLHPHGVQALNEVLENGCWSGQRTFGLSERAQWQGKLLKDDGTEFEVFYQGKLIGAVKWNQTGEHSVNNGLAAIAAAHHVGVVPAEACEALGAFKGVKRRMECLADIDGIKVYDDFAHHPTAIETTLNGLRKNVGTQRVIALIEPRSNTMKLGSHKKALAPATAGADMVFWYQPPNIDWQVDDLAHLSPVPAVAVHHIEEAVEKVCAEARDFAAEGQPCHVVIMSNGGFGGIHGKIVEALKA